jgi:hypothetical protein
MWQCLEILSGSGTGKTEDIAAKISKLWVNGIDELKPLVEILADLRNSYVHAGLFNVEDKEAVLIANDIASKAMYRYWVLAQDLPTDGDFEQYQKSVTLSKGDFERQSRVAKFVAEQRQR